jgi:hypothetical protein
MKRLFMLRRGKSGSPVKGEDGAVMYFGNKMEAKKARGNPENSELVVSFGPDHNKFKHGGK